MTHISSVFLRFVHIRVLISFEDALGLQTAPSLFNRKSLCIKIQNLKVCILSVNIFLISVLRNLRSINLKILKLFFTWTREWKNLLPDLNGAQRLRLYLCWIQFCFFLILLAFAQCLINVAITTSTASSLILCEISFVNYFRYTISKWIFLPQLIVLRLILRRIEKVIIAREKR